MRNRIRPLAGSPVVGPLPALADNLAGLEVLVGIDHLIAVFPDRVAGQSTFRCVELEGKQDGCFGLYRGFTGEICDFHQCPKAILSMQDYDKINSRIAQDSPLLLQQRFSRLCRINPFLQEKWPVTVCCQGATDIPAFLRPRGFAVGGTRPENGHA